MPKFVIAKVTEVKPQSCWELVSIWVMNIKILFAQGRIKFSRFFLKIERLPEFLILQSRLFHSDIVEGKNEFLK